MSPEMFWALAAFSFASSVTPGPNNIMLLASGVNFGFRRSIPHMLGIGIGFVFLMLCIGLGLGQLLDRLPALHGVLKIAAAGYMLWLAWKIANSGPLEEKTGGAAPLTFIQAAAFQWVNPKAWFMALTAVSLYTVPANYPVTLLIAALVFGVINLPTVSLWCGMGTLVRHLLTNPATLKIFNIAMAILLVASLWPMLSS